MFDVNLKPLRFAGGRFDGQLVAGSIGVGSKPHLAGLH